MTRKKYIHNMQRLALAIYNHPDSFYPDGYKIGKLLKRIKREAKDVPSRCGSYENAWNNIERTRHHYGID